MMAAMKFKLPSRGKWISDRAAFYRGQGLRALAAITEAAKDWDEGRPIGPQSQGRIPATLAGGMADE